MMMGNVAPAHEALRLALPLLRDDAASDIEGCWLFDRVGDDFWPRPSQTGVGPVPQDLARVETKLAAIRAAEACVGRVPDGQPAWLDAILDGRRPL